MLGGVGGGIQLPMVDESGNESGTQRGLYTATFIHTKLRR